MLRGSPSMFGISMGQQHGFFTIDPWSDASAELMRVIKRLVDTDGRFD
jgi:hypothetical protein